MIYGVSGAETPQWPKNPPDNWMTYHLAHPGPGNAKPADPNPAFYYKGRYHLHYIYRNSAGFAFGHVSSKDMVNWKWHPTVLDPSTTGGHGMFSGTGFFTKQGKPVIIYHGDVKPAITRRIWIQYALDDQLNGWSDPEIVTAKTAEGHAANIAYGDPDCWLNGETYYATSGGRHPQLMKSMDLKNWTYLGDLLHEDYSAKKLGIPRGEDISCANMFKIGKKWMLLCLSHPLGCRYYLGDFKDEKYLPDFHAHMNFTEDGPRQGYFAPESLLTRDGRRVVWTWIRGMPLSPKGVQALPRELELPKDGVLRMKPLRELEKLRYDQKQKKKITVKSGDSYPLKVLTGDALEMEITFSAPLPEEFGLNLLGNEKDGNGGMSIIAGADKKVLTVGNLNAPFQLKKDEDLILRIFIDKNLVEVFANDRQAASYVHKPHIRKNPNISLFAKGSDLKVKKVAAWKMKSIYQGDSVFKGK